MYVILIAVSVLRTKCGVPSLKTGANLSTDKDKNKS